MEDNIFLERIKSYGTLSEEAEKELMSKICSIRRFKGDRIVREGQVATSFYIIKSGMVRSYYKKSNTDVTIWFAYEGQIAVSTASLFGGKPSRETVECLEECELLYIPNNDLRGLYRKYECINTIGRKLAEEYCSILDERAYQLQVMSATDRYKDLLEHQPEIIQRAPLSNIASFLGISQETLSRIRHKW